MTLEQDFTVRLLKELDSECFLLGSKISGTEGHELGTLFMEDTGILEKRQALVKRRENLTSALANLKKVAPNCVAQRPKIKIPAAPPARPAPPRNAQTASVRAARRCFMTSS